MVGDKPKCLTKVTVAGRCRQPYTVDYFHPLTDELKQTFQTYFKCAKSVLIFLNSPPCSWFGKRLEKKVFFQVGIMSKGSPATVRAERRSESSDSSKVRGGLVLVALQTEGALCRTQLLKQLGQYMWRYITLQAAVSNKTGDR